MPTATEVQRVLVIDDHQVFTDLLARALHADGGFACVGGASSVAEARRVAGTTDFDVAVVDVHLPDGDGVCLAQELLAMRPSARVLILTGYPRHDIVTRVLAMGASGLLVKDGALHDLLDALRNASAQHPVIADLSGTPEHGLTARELDVLGLLGDGKDTVTIARVLGISQHTSRDHVKNILAKLGANSQLDAVVIASRAGIIEVGRR